MKKAKMLAMAAGILSLAFIYSCKKDKDDDVQLDAQSRQHNEDSNNYKSETDQADSDINGALENVSGFGRGAGVMSSPLCGCTIDSSQLAQKILYFNFDGTTWCFSPSRKRSGQIKAELTSGNLWSDPGAVLTLTYINFKVTFSNNRFIMFNGVKTLKNINGNNWLGFILGTATLKYQSRAFNVNVSFDDGSSAVWNTAHVTEWSYTPAQTKITFTATGDTSLNGYSNVQGWGTNRYGYSFTSYFNSTLRSDTYCGLWRFSAGEWVHQVNGATLALTLGVDENGTPTPNTCGYGYKVTWQYDGKTYSIVISY